MLRGRGGDKEGQANWVLHGQEARSRVHIPDDSECERVVETVFGASDSEVGFLWDAGSLCWDDGDVVGGEGGSSRFLSWGRVEGKSDGARAVCWSTLSDADSRENHGEDQKEGVSQDDDGRKGDKWDM